MLAAMGAAIIDSDRLGHEQLQRADIVAQLCRWWGDGILTETGAADRSAISRIVFKDAAELARLEALLHPLIEQRRREIMVEMLPDPGVKAIVLDAPKLLEAGLRAECNAVVFVDAPRAERVRRVAEARGWSEKELDRRENLQFPLDKKRALADYVVVNHSDVEVLRREVEKMFSAIIKNVT